METGGALAGGEQAGHGAHLRIGVHFHAAHHVVRGGAYFHGVFRDVEIAQLFELVVHAGELAFDDIGAVGQALFDPGDIEENAAMRAAAPFTYFALNAAGDVVARQEFGRAASFFIALRVAPAFFFVVGGLAFVERRNIVEHEALAVFVAQHAAFAADAFGDQDAAHAGRPHHAGGMELNELHVEQFRAGMISQRVAVAGVLPTVAGDLISASDTAGGEDDGLGAEEAEAPAFPVIAEDAGDAIAVFQKRQHGDFHVEINALMDAVILEGADHLQTGAVAHMRQARIAVAAEVTLEDVAVFGTVKQRAPLLQFANAVGRFLRVQLRHSPMVEILAAAHGVGEMNTPTVAAVNVAHGRGDTAFGHHRVRFA